MPAAIASVGMSSTAERQRAYQSRSAGLQGARAKPQLLMTTEVTPCQHEQLPNGSQATWASMCVCPSMNPGDTIRPSASMTRLAPSPSLPIAAMRPLAIPTSATNRGAPLPSTTVPPRNSRSKPIHSSSLFSRAPVAATACVSVGPTHLSDDILPNPQETALRAVHHGAAATRKYADGPMSASCKLEHSSSTRRIMNPFIGAAPGGSAVRRYW